MKELRKYIPLALILIAISMIIRYEIKNLTSNEWFIFDVFEVFFWYILALIIAVPTVIGCLKRLKANRSLFNYLPLYIIGIGVVLVISLVILNNIENTSPVILKGYYDGDINGLGLELREDGTYRIDNSSILGGQYFEGTYRLEADTIVLDKNKPLGGDNDFMTNQLLISEGKILFRLDTNGNWDRSWITMKIIENKFKK